jgi:hypothetical protein
MSWQLVHGGSLGPPQLVLDWRFWLDGGRAAAEEDAARERRTSPSWPMLVIEDIMMYYDELLVSNGSETGC